MIQANVFLKYDPYFKAYPFVGSIDLKCRLLRTPVLSDGRYHYFGDSVETMRHGVYGIMLSLNPQQVLSIYEGAWKSDAYHGKGSLYTLSHPLASRPMLRLMQGHWNNGLLHGRATIKHYDQHRQQWDTTFDGEFRHGEKTGFGVERDERSLYRGQFSKGCRTGKGRLEDIDGNFFDGEFEKGFLVGAAFESVGDSFIITDSAHNRKVYRKPEEIEEFTLKFSQLIHQIVAD